MTEQERIEGINSEQLATATDRVLLASRFGRARPSTLHLHARSGSLQIYARGSAPLISGPAQFARGTSQYPLASSKRIADELTVFTRRPKHYKAPWRKLTTIALITSLISVATAIALLV